MEVGFSGLRFKIKQCYVVAVCDKLAWPRLSSHRVVFIVHFNEP